MLGQFSIRDSEPAKAFIAQLSRAASALSHSEKSTLITRYDRIYGDLTGQRALSDDDIKLYGGYALDGDRPDATNFILALETYFSLICSIITASALHDNPSLYLRSTLSKRDAHFLRTIGDIASGKEQEGYGVRHALISSDFNWYCTGTLSKYLESFRYLLTEIAVLWETGFLALPDPIQLLHDITFPRNLVHTTGQFYTPPWLCDVLIEDMDISSDALIVDPFCGSGAFLVRALERLRMMGQPLNQSMKNVLGIDVNPSACVAARTNLILYARKSGLRDFSDLSINILCADSLCPAVVEGMQSHDLFQSPVTRMVVDGHQIDVNVQSLAEQRRISSVLRRNGIATDTWLPRTKGMATSTDDFISPVDRRISEQLALFAVQKADILLTNPPWVGWEYLSRSYRDYITPAWSVYNLFEQKGLEASFLKEDISTLCIAAACDHFLAEGGSAAIVVRPAAMQSSLAGRGLRRLTIYENSGELELKEIRLFEGMKVFGNAAAPAATWHLKKGHESVFPIPVRRWIRRTARWQPTAASTLAEVRSNVDERWAVCSPTDAADISSRWTIADQRLDDLRSKTAGSNSLQPRIGFFTGGANAVYYMRPTVRVSEHLWKCSNITERAKRQVAQVNTSLESDLIFSVLRGRDLSFWGSRPEVFVLCPHTIDTRIYPLEEHVLRSEYPYAHSYLASMRDALMDRNGFAGWEKSIHKQYFYTLQRIGAYTFSPYKVCWSYISSDFTVAVVGPDERQRPIFPNDKVVFIPFEEPREAFFIAGVLSSVPIRMGVVASVSSRQVSANVIKHFSVPAFDPLDPVHCQISEACRDGHKALSDNRADLALAYYEAVNSSVGSLFGFTSAEIAAFRSGLIEKLGFYPFKL